MKHSQPRRSDLDSRDFLDVAARAEEPIPAARQNYAGWRLIARERSNSVQESGDEIDVQSIRWRTVHRHHHDVDIAFDKERIRACHSRKLLKIASNNVPNYAAALECDNTNTRRRFLEQHILLLWHQTIGS